MTRHGSVLYTGKGNLYLNITNQCTNDCEFCIRHYADGLWGYTLILEEKPTLDEILSELKATDLSPYDEVVFTGFGEPLLRLFDVVEITRYLKSKGKRVRIDTNGTVAPLYPNINIPKILKDAGVDAISISLNAEDAPHYEEICHPTIPDSYKELLELTAGCRDVGIDVRLTVVGTCNIDIEACRRIAETFGVGFHIR